MEARWATKPIAEETRRPVKGGPKTKQGIEATMNVAVRSHATTKQASEHFDVLIVGAGISGIGSAYHLTKQLPGTSFVILETQETFGGTWTTHRYQASAPTAISTPSAIASSPGSARRSRPPKRSSPT